MRRLPEKLTNNQFTQADFDKVAAKVDEEVYWDTNRAKQLWIVNKETGRREQVNAKDYFDSLPDVAYSTDVEETAVWRDDPNNPKMVKEDSKDVD